MKIWPPVWEWRVCNPLAHPPTVNLSFQKSTFIPNTPICNQSRPCHFLYMFILLLITFYLHQVDELLPTIYFFLLIQRFIYLTSSVWARFPNASFFFLSFWYMLHCWHFHSMTTHCWDLQSQQEEERLCVKQKNLFPLLPTFPAFV
jgi:hypothetical protein